ncbi:MAG: ABC transporter substrate-binding protein [Desulfobacteraceae bacterium]|nr:ABC transporter substrate-binding protein [Desulfobacteraceae bacterium]
MEDLKAAVKLYQQGGISRREFIKRACALGLAAAASPLLNPFPAQAAGPKRGGRLRIGITGGSTTDSLDPALITDLMMQVFLYGAVGNSLVEIDADGQAVPELAESWESTQDAKKWIFKLRRGAELHNGKTIDADDVIFSINRHRAKGSKSAAKAIVKAITKINKVDKFTVSFELKSGNADFPYILSDYHLIIGAKDSDFGKGVFSGAYVVKDFEPGVRAFATKNPNYFKTDRGWFDEVEFFCINDVNARTNALKTGQIDVMNRCELKTVHLLKRSRNLQVMRQDGFKHFTFAMRTDKAPYDNNEVRMALKYAIDREQMVKTILRGYGTVGNDHPISPANRYFAKNLPQRRYDPDKARHHLKKAGLKDMKFKLHTAEAAYVGAVDAGVLYREQAAKAGIQIDVIREPNDGYWNNVWLKKSWCAVFWGGRPTEDMMFSTGYAKGAAWNDTFWDHKRFNKLLLDARSELDDKKRRSMYAQMQKLVRDEGGAVVPMFSADLSAASKKVGHDKLAVNWELDGFRAPERWWFNS